jgi:hypothetical protein
MFLLAGIEHAASKGVTLALCIGTVCQNMPKLLAAKLWRSLEAGAWPRPTPWDPSLCACLASITSVWSICHCRFPFEYVRLLNALYIFTYYYILSITIYYFTLSLAVTSMAVRLQIACIFFLWEYIYNIIIYIYICVCFYLCLFVVRF